MSVDLRESFEELGASFSNEFESLDIWLEQFNEKLTRIDQRLLNIESALAHLLGEEVSEEAENTVHSVVFGTVELPSGKYVCKFTPALDNEAEGSDK